jgi:hypothetical protein
MLNIKKGLAVALAAATVLTFAPTSVFAGTTAATKREDAVDSKGNHTNIAGGLKTTMNESANVWSYDNSSLTGSAALRTEQTAYVVLTPSNPEGSVTFTENITSLDNLSTGKWFTNMTTTGGADAAADNKEANGILELTAGKNSKTLNIRASVAKLRQLTHPESYTVNHATSSALAEGTTVTVILANHAVKMNNLKVVMGTAGDSAHDRYVKHGADEYDAFEARPNGVGTNDITTTDKVDVALDGVKISKKTLNLADSSKDIPFKSVESNAEVTYKSDDTNIVTVDKDGIHAKAVGNTNVTISTKQSLTAYGEVTVTFPVEVINKPAATLSAPDDIYVHGLDKENEVTIGATGTNIQKNSIKYEFVHWNALTQDWENYASYANGGARRNPFKLDETKDAVYVLSYTGDDDKNYDWDAYLKVTATAADGYTAPAPKYVRLHFVKNSSLFALDAYKQDLHVGESVQITTKSVTAVSGAAFSYKSINPAVATVSDTGVIKAVSEGSTQVEVSYGGGKQYVTVTVTNYENGTGSTETPAKVTGVKVSNKKGAKVTVKFNKVTTAPTMKYYVQKKVSGKTAGKSVGSAKTTLSVKKGATVKVRVKAYYYDVNGDKHVGAYSAWKTLKTDKK